MAAKLDIFNPQISKVAKGLEGKIIFIYGGNGVGKTYTAAHMEKPFFILCESGLNALAGIPYGRVNTWSNFKSLVNQLTNPNTVEKAREMYSTIVVDEIYAASIFCQDYITSTYGEGALTLGDMMGKRNGYDLYEKEFFRVINKLLSADYTVVFIGHAQEKKDYIFPKGDKRCLGPIMDNSDFIIYVSSNGVDEKGKVIKSTGNFFETNTYFARTRFTECVSNITPFSAENLEKAIIDAIKAEEEKTGIAAISYQEQKEMNAPTQIADFETVMVEIQQLCMSLTEAGYREKAVEIIEDTLGPGMKVSACTKKQIDALTVILEDLKELAGDLPTE